MRQVYKKGLFCMVLLIVFVSWADAYTKFGFNYWPAGYSCDVLYSANWTTANKNVVKYDLNIMRSYSTEVLRLMVWPQKSGYLLQQNNGGYFTQDFNDVTDNFLELLDMCEDRGIKVVLSFGNNYHTSLVPPDNTQYWWEWAYGSSSSDFTEFLGDTRTWINGFVDKIEDSDWADTVIYYDYHNEWTDRRTYGDWYIQYLYDWTNIPAGKRYVSLLSIDTYNDAAELKNALGSRVVDALDFHSYPALSANSDIEAGYNTVAAQYPGKPIYLGEYGRSCADSSGETAQETTVTDLTSRAITKGFAGMMHWMLWDNAPPSSNAIAGWGYTWNSPKDVMGAMASTLLDLANPDMETISSNKPTNWSNGGTVSTTLTTGAGGYSATNDRYARVSATAGSGVIWLTSSLTPVNAGSVLCANCFFRANLNSVQMSINQYNSSYGLITTNYGPSYTPPAWQMYNYLRVAGDWKITLNANTAYVIVGIRGTIRSGVSPSYLDIDTVSLW